VYCGATIGRNDNLRRHIDRKHRGPLSGPQHQPLDDDEAGENIKTYQERLRLAARDGMVEEARALIGKGVDVNAPVDPVAGYIPLHLAVKYGHEAIVRLLLDSGADINCASTKSKQTPLHLAAKHGHTAIAAALLDKGANVDAQAGWPPKYTPLDLAAQYGHSGVTNILLARGASIRRGKHCVVPLNLAAQHGHLDVVNTILLDKDNIQDSQATTALCIAAQHGHEGIVNVLLDKWPQIIDYYGLGWNIPLEVAVGHGQVAIVKILVDRGADVHSYKAKHLFYDAVEHVHKALARIDHAPSATLPHGSHDPDPQNHAQTASKSIIGILARAGFDVNSGSWSNKTALHYAAEYGYKDIAQCLLDNGADVNAAGYNHQTPLHYAARGGHKDVAQWLIENGADVNAVDRNHQTPLQYAASGGHKEVVSLLVERGANIHCKDKFGKTPLHIAISQYPCHENLVRYLLEQGSHIDACDGSGRTPLHTAACSGHSNIVRILLGRGADVNALDASGYTPLHIAARSWSPCNATILLDYGVNVNAWTLSGQSNETPFWSALLETQKTSKRRNILSGYDTLKLLARRGADLQQELRAMTPLQWAMQQNNRKLQSVLEELIRDQAFGRWE
jgi:ankyrin repeat protein